VRTTRKSAAAVPSSNAREGRRGGRSVLVVAVIVVDGGGAELIEFAATLGFRQGALQAAFRAVLEVVPAVLDVIVGATREMLGNVGPLVAQ